MSTYRSNDTTEKERGVFIEHTPCPYCNSSDAGASYDDGSWHCHSCEAHECGSGTNTRAPLETEKRTTHKDLLTVKVSEITARGLTLKTAERYSYGLSTYKHPDGRKEAVHVAQYRNALGEVCAQHLRTRDKDFKWVGQPKRIMLFGQHLWSASKYIVLTEGEIDAMSVAQAFGLKWGAVSVPNGAAAAKRDVGKNVAWLEQFESIVVWFDSDEPGRKAADAVAEILAPGKVKIVSSSAKDANELLLTEGPGAVLQAVYSAQPYRPDGIYDSSELISELMQHRRGAVDHGLIIPYRMLDIKLNGLYKKRLYIFTAGSGVGKTTLVHELAFDLRITYGQRIGYIALEESNNETMTRLVSLHLSKPLSVTPTLCTDDEFEASARELFSPDGLFLYDHFGSVDSTNLLQRMRFLACGCGVDWIVFDHISISISGAEVNNDERRLLDKLMTDLRSFVESTGVGMLVICHLRKKANEAKAHEEGGRVRSSDLRGSQSIMQLSDVVVAMERDTQGTDTNTSDLRVLKNRITGKTGFAGTVVYDPDTGRLSDDAFAM